MFYLAGETEPTQNETLSSSLEAGIGEVVQLAAGTKTVGIEGQFPRLSLLKIDLTDGRIDPSRKTEKPVGVGPAKLAFFTSHFQIAARPLFVGHAPIKLDLSARDASFQYDRSASGRLILLPASLNDGRASIEVSKADLERLILSQANLAALKQGAKITDLKLHLELRGEHSIGIDLRVTAKKMMMSGTIRVVGVAEIDNQLIAHVSGLDCTGDGVVGKFAAGVLAGKLKQFEGKTFPLSELAFAGIQPRSVRVESVDPLRITATFGS